MATSGSAVTMLAGTSRINPMTYALFGAHTLDENPKGLKGDKWIGIVGNLNSLEDLATLRTMLDRCMLRVYEGIIMGRTQERKIRPIVPGEEDRWSEDEDEDDNNRALSSLERKELGLMTKDLVRILETYSYDRLGAISRTVSRPITPIVNHRLLQARGSASSHTTPYGSRTSTPLPMSKLADSAQFWRRRD